MAYIYSLRGYGKIIADGERTEAYRQALRQAVKPGAAVLDIGTGTGILALLACQCGARRVYAIEPGDVIEVARELAGANGYADRIVFIQALSTQVTLPEPVDVIVSDLHGIFPLFEKGIAAIIDARRRFLSPGGVLIPRRETLWGALTEVPDIYERLTAVWNDNNYGLNLTAVQKLVTNDFQRNYIKAEQLLASPRCWGTLDYETIESLDIRSDVTWSVPRPGTAQGLVLWFDADMAMGVGFSNAPGKPERVFGQGFFPWPEPFDLAVGDTVSAAISADLVGDDYIWRWDTRIQDPDGRLKANFRQSTFHGVPLSPGRLQQMAASHVPELSADGRMDRFILELMDGKHALGEIAHRIAAQFPGRFANEKEALTRAGELSIRYGRALPNRYIKNT
jgi:protein arginine N-methyltransferase 1